MNEKTKSSYRKLANHFYKKRLDGQQPTGKRIADALKECAGEYRPAYWRRLRNALAFDQAEKGYSDAAERINAAKNPVTKPGSGLAVKQKQKRVNRVTEADENKLVDYFVDRDDKEVIAALYVVQHTGVRPAEMSGIRVIAPDKILIPGAKKSHGGKRGADRVIQLPPDVVGYIGKAVSVLQKDDMTSVQNKLAAAGRKLWPQRKSTPTLYSWRHQMGADLKASGIGRDELAYIMGHQSTESADRYGNPRTARGGRVLPKPDAEADLSGIRIDHGNPPSAPSADVEKVDAVREIHTQKRLKRQWVESGLSL